MAIALDTTSSAFGTGSGSGTTFSWSHTVGVGSTVLIVAVLGTADTITAVTVGATSILANLIAKTNTTLGAGNEIYYFYMNNPPSGAQTIAGTFSNSQGVLWAFASTFTGTDTTSAVVDSSHADYISTGSGAPSQTLAQSTTVVTANSWILGVNVFSNGGTVTINNSAVIRQQVSPPGATYWDSNAAETAGSHSFTSTTTAAGDRWSGLAISIKPPSATVRLLSSTGAGV